MGKQSNPVHLCRFYQHLRRRIIRLLPKPWSYKRLTYTAQAYSSRYLNVRDGSSHCSDINVPLLQTPTINIPALMSSTNTHASCALPHSDMNGIFVKVQGFALVSTSRGRTRSACTF